MNRFIFLPSWLFFGLIVIGIYGFYQWVPIFFWLFFFSTLFIFYLFRKYPTPFRETQKIDGEILLSPVHGRVESIRRDTMVWDELPGAHEIRISIPLVAEKGLYLPTSGEVSYLKANKGIKIPKSADGQNFFLPAVELAHTDLVLKSKSTLRTLMRFVDCPMGMRPYIWLKSGDRGRAGACFGHYPFGGTLIIYLPPASDILVFEGENLTPSKSVLAAFKNKV